MLCFWQVDSFCTDVQLLSFPECHKEQRFLFCSLLLILCFLKWASINLRSRAQSFTKLFLWTYGGVFLFIFFPPLVPKVRWIQTGEVNIVECLILYTCGDYVPFDIRYALVKWGLTAFPVAVTLTSTRVRTYACTHTHKHLHPHVLIKTGTCSIDVCGCEKDKWVKMVFPPYCCPPRSLIHIKANGFFFGPD